MPSRKVSWLPKDNKPVDLYQPGNLDIRGLHEDHRRVLIDRQCVSFDDRGLRGRLDNPAIDHIQIIAIDLHRQADFGIRKLEIYERSADR